ncbi:glycosyltransferase [Rhodococcus cercidiphylli]|uniref:Glycosyltransferase n=1 Tax=Rhodococcus cercidiphylli TaxID=489916 RepID=A0ABU4B3V4_9NOCA|nr:glycosyltransferase [Rhodococcus cercidiphylli]MDV6233170.1 glycosyltransferase [Rhodococcus cercidiphylli]
MRRVAIVHPWMPQYRVDFFNQLESKLRAQSIELRVFYGETPPEWNARADSSNPDRAIKLRTKFINIRGRSLSYKRLRPVRSQSPYDLLIVEQAIRNIETYQLFMFRRRYAKRIAFWGHGRTYTARKSRAEEFFKQKLTQKASWFFSYTEGGISSITRAGYPEERTTVVQNSIDTTSLKIDLDAATRFEVESFIRLHSLTDKTLIYIGGIDSAKRIDFLLTAAQGLHDIDEDYRLLVVGAGDDAGRVADLAAKEDYLIYLGPLFGKDKAIAMKASRAMMIPGRVGLIAVDSLVSGLPIFTTDWPYHAPEFEYLTNDRTVIVTDNDVTTYTATIAKTMGSNNLSRISENCRHLAKEFSTEYMADRFCQGIASALEEDTDLDCCRHD